MQTLTIPPAGVEFNYIIPTISPFYLDGISVSIVATSKSWCSVPYHTSTPLVMGIDWEPSLRFASATAELGAPVYFAINFMDTALAGTVTITGTTADGSYALTNNQITALANSGVDPLVTTYESFFNITAPYQSTDLAYRTTNAQYIPSLVSAINAIDTSFASGGPNSVFNFNKHASNNNNPHAVVATDIGLGNVPNWVTGTSQDIVNANPSAFVTPAAFVSTISTIIPQATTNNDGSFILNTGTIAGDASNAVKALTAAGLVNLITSGTPNAINVFFNKPRQAVPFNPFPLTYPVTWRGTQYQRFTDLVAAVSAYTGINNLMYSDQMGIIWFPNSYTVPVGLLNHT